MRGLSQFATIVPVKLEPTQADASYFDQLVARINSSRADLVHIQHEYSFFGPNVPTANRQLNRLMRGSTHRWLLPCTPCGQIF